MVSLLQQQEEKQRQHDSKHNNGNNDNQQYGTKRMSVILSSSSASSSSSSTTITTTLSIPMIMNTFDACSTKSMLNSAIAGYVAGISGVIIGHPLDSAKVWLQTNSIGTNKHLATTTTTTTRPTNTTTTATTTSSSSPKASTTTTASSSSPRSAFGTANYMSTLSKDAISLFQNTSSTSTRISNANNNDLHLKKMNTLTKTIRALYSGASVPFVTVGIVQSINFMIYDSMRRLLYKYDTCHIPTTTTTTTTNTITNTSNYNNNNDYLNNDSLINITIAGFISGGILAYITTPLLMIKTQQQVTGNGFRQTFYDLFVSSNNNSKTTITTTTTNTISTTTTRRPPSRFVGFGPHFISVTIGRSIYYFTYEYSKRQLIQYKQQQQQLTMKERMICAGIAGIMCWSIIFPFDALRCRMFDQSRIRTSSKRTTIEMIQLMLYENNYNTNNNNTKPKVISFRSFYRGYGITVLRAGPVAAAVLPIYDKVLETLSSQS